MHHHPDHHDHHLHHHLRHRVLHDLYERLAAFGPGAWDDDEADQACAGGHHGHPRGRGRHGFRHFGFGGGGPGGFGFRAGRKLSSAELQLVLLHLLGEKPRHGYELIKAVEELSKGFYVPSPGVIYPALTYLEELGDAAAELEGNRKRYQLTDAGRAHLAERAAELKDLLAALERLGRGMDRVREAFADDEAGEPGGEAAGQGEGGGLHAGVRELRGAFRALRAALHAKRGAPREELERVAEILVRAAEEIAGRRG